MQDQESKLQKVIDRPITIKPIHFEQIESEKYDAEFAVKNGAFIYHIYFKGEPQDIDKTFIKVFRDTNRIKKLFVEEFNCWTYIVKGFADNPFAASLKMELFKELDNDLK